MISVTLKSLVVYSLLLFGKVSGQLTQGNCSCQEVISPPASIPSPIAVNNSPRAMPPSPVDFFEEEELDQGLILDKRKQSQFPYGQCGIINKNQINQSIVISIFSYQLSHFSISRVS